MAYPHWCPDRFSRGSSHLRESGGAALGKSLEVAVSEGRIKIVFHRQAQAAGGLFRFGKTVE